MALNWINPDDYSFNSFLMLERFQIRLMLDSCGWRRGDEAWKRNIGIALNANPAVMWYFMHRCPERRDVIEALSAHAPSVSDPRLIREAETGILLSVEDFTVYTTPQVMDEKCDFIRGWDKSRLFSLADFTGKTVLDVGAGSGRLAFAAAERASMVFASEPVGTLREFMRDKIELEGIKNIRVTDGFVTSLPFPDSLFDIVMSGHVVGDDYDVELAELGRVCRPGGWMLDCPGDSERDMCPRVDLTARGWQQIRYTGSYGKDVYLYRKQATE